MSNKLEIRNERANFDFIFPEFHKEFFADGLAQILVGNGISKFSLFSSDGPNEAGIEQRKETMRICMSNVALRNLATQILKRLDEEPPAITTDGANS